MSDQLGSPHLRVLFEAALEDYKQQTGIRREGVWSILSLQLSKHPLAECLQDCNSIESVTTILREQAQDSKGLRR